MSGKAPMDSLLSTSSQSPFLPVIASVLDAVSSTADKDTKSAYDASVIPSIKLYDYLRRWVRYTRCPVICVVCAVMLVDKACIQTGLLVTPVNVHRLLLAALALACKWYLDRPFLNSCYAKIGGVSTADIGALERRLLRDLDWEVGVSMSEMNEYEIIFRGHRAWPVLRTPASSAAPVDPRRASIGRGTDASTDCLSTLPPTEVSNVTTDINAEVSSDVAPAFVTEKSTDSLPSECAVSTRRQLVPTPPTEGERDARRSSRPLLPTPPPPGLPRRPSPRNLSPIM
eukprot:Hpha_TRINITY_DN15042_c3_g1::TRINITY_DN15042_c3_g1_i2::g.125795::m.125795